MMCSLGSIDEARRVFDKYDKNGDGKISSQELLEAMHWVCQKAKTAEEAEQIISKIDRDGDEHIDFTEFLEFFRGGSQDSNGDNNETLRDVDWNLLFSVSKLDSSLKLSSSLSDKRMISSSVDKDGDGNVNLNLCLSLGKQRNLEEQVPLQLHVHVVATKGRMEAVPLVQAGEITGEGEESDTHQLANRRDRDHRSTALRKIAQPKRHVELPENLRASLETKKLLQQPKHGNDDWLYPKTAVVMLVASVIATVTFQAAIMPPGGVWQDDLTEDANGNPFRYLHRAGMAIMAYNQKKGYGLYVVFNTMAFLASLSIILLQVSGLPMNQKRLMRVQMVGMWIAISALVIAYFLALRNTSPENTNKRLRGATEIVGLSWLCLVTVALLGNVLPINLWILEKYVLPKKKEKQPAAVAGHHEEEKDLEAITVA